MKLYRIPKVKGMACSLQLHPQIKLARGKGIYAKPSTDQMPSSVAVQVRPTREVDMSHVGRALQAIPSLHAKTPRKVRL